MASESDLEQAFIVAEPVIQERYGRMFKRAKVSHRYDADDLVQQTFYKAWRSVGQCKAQDVPAIVNWLLKIAANCARTALTANKKVKRRCVNRERQLCSLVDDKPVDFEVHDDPTARLMRQSEVSVVLAVMDRLPKAWGIMLRMRYLGGKTFQEIAAELGVSESSVRGSISTALDRVRTESNQYSLPGFEVDLIAEEMCECSY